MKTTGFIILACSLTLFGSGIKDDTTDSLFWLSLGISTDCGLRQIVNNGDIVSPFGIGGETECLILNDYLKKLSVERKIKKPVLKFNTSRRYELISKPITRMFDTCFEYSFNNFSQVSRHGVFQSTALSENLKLTVLNKMSEKDKLYYLRGIYIKSGDTLHSDNYQKCYFKTPRYYNVHKMLLKLLMGFDCNNITDSIGHVYFDPSKLLIEQVILPSKELIKNYSNKNIMKFVDIIGPDSK
jgi:hypothetical protein